MNSRLILVCLAVTIVSVMAQNPKPCSTPPLWEARHFTYDHMRGEFSRGFVAYDATYKRMRTVEEFHEDRDEEAFDVIRLNAQNVEYVYNFKTKECKKQALTREWRDFGIPANAKNIAEYYVGSSGIPNAGLLTTAWEDEFKNHEGKDMYYLGVWTYEACLPVKIEVYERPDKQTKGIAYHDQFFDIVPGVKPDAFKLRKECEGL